MTQVPPLARIHVAQRIDSAAIDALAALFDVSVGFGPNARSMPEVIGEVQALVVRNSPVDKTLLNRAGRLRAIVRSGAGLDGIDVEHARANGIQVSNTAGSNERSVAEHTLALTLAAARSIAHWDAVAREGGYARRDESPGIELFGKRWGIVGYGRIGRDVARLAHNGLAMDVVAFGGSRLATDPGVATAAPTLEALLVQSDVVSVHVPLTPATRGLFGSREFAAMKPSAIFINVSRGPVVDSTALLSALVDHVIHAAAIDVWDGPFPAPPHPLYEAPNLTLSPHRAGRTAEADRNAGDLVVERLRELFGVGPELPP